MTPINYFDYFVRSDIPNSQIQFVHFRNHNDDGISNMGGATLAYVIWPIGDNTWADTFNVAYAVSACSIKDNFSRATGRNMSQDRFNVDPVKRLIIFQKRIGMDTAERAFIDVFKKDFDKHGRIFKYFFHNNFQLKAV